MRHSDYESCPAIEGIKTLVVQVARLCNHSMNHALLLKGLRPNLYHITRLACIYESCPAIEGIKTVLAVIVLSMNSL